MLADHRITHTDNPLRYTFLTGRREWFALVLLIATVVCVFGVVVARQITVSFDYETHIRIAEEWLTTGTVDRPLPHFLTQVLIIALHTIIPSINWNTAGWLTSILSYTLLSIVLYLLLYPRFKALTVRFAALLASMFALALMVIYALDIPTWYWLDYWGYVQPNNYHNPTVVVLKPLALLSFVAVLKVYPTLPTHPPVQSILWTGLVIALATLAKPNFTICIVPALALFTAWRVMRGAPVRWRLLLFGIALPIAVILLWQYGLLAERGGIEFAPFRVMLLFTPPGWLFPKFLLSIAFPIVVYMLHFQNARRSTLLNLAWLSFVFGAFYTYFLAEGGNGWRAGNFLWSGQVTLFILMVASALFWLEQMAIAGETAPLGQRRNLLCAAIFLLHVISGVNLLLGAGIAWWPSHALRDLVRSIWYAIRR